MKSSSRENSFFAEKEAQGATEMVIVLAMTLVVLTVIIALSQDVIGVTKQDITESTVDSALSDIESAARTVYMQGEGAKTEVTLEMPSRVDSVSVENETVEFALVTGGKKYRTFDFNVIGGFEPSPGLHVVPVKAIGDRTVLIGEEISECGNGTIEGTEECDGSNLDGETCESLGYDGGTLSCSECSFDTSQCFSYRYWIIDTESEWNTGAFENTSTDGNGNLILNSTTSGKFIKKAVSETVNTGSVDAGAVKDTKRDDGNTKEISEENVGTGGPNQDFQLDIEEFFESSASPTSGGKIEIITNSWTDGEDFKYYVYNYSSGSYVDTGTNIDATSDGTTYTTTICSSGCDIIDDPSNYINSTGDMSIQYRDTLSNEGRSGSSATLSIDYQAIRLSFSSLKYFSPGTYNSTVFDAGETVSWEDSTINASVPSGTSYSISYAEKSTGTWSYYDSIASVPDSQRLMFNVTLEGDSTTTPELDYVNITYRETG